MKGFYYGLFLLLALPSSQSLGSEIPVKPILQEFGHWSLVASAPNEQRDEKYIGLLGISLKIHVNGASGSGTICHYDESSGVAHVISCGHLWSGNMKYTHGSILPRAKVTTWYKNGKKLNSSESFEAEVLFWSNDRGYDVSLLRFKPDWVPEFAPIDGSFRLERGTVLNSMGCDGGHEVARYEVEFHKISDMDIITNKNSPRPGRSGGGLVTDCGRIVGVCWGTSDIHSGNGIGYFTPVSSIKKVFCENQHGWLLDVVGFRHIPILDRDAPGSTYDPDYVPHPSRL